MKLPIRDINLLVALNEAPNRVLDFGIPLPYPVLCTAYTVEKITLWQHTTRDNFEMIALRAPFMHRARAEGTLYRLTDEEVFDLDRQRGTEVNCRRERMPIYVPNGDFTEHTAHIYMGISERWVEEINYGSTVTREFKLADTLPDPIPLLNFRFRFLPPIINVQPPGIISPAIAKNVRKRNREEMRRLNVSSFFRNLLSNDL